MFFPLLIDLERKSDEEQGSVAKVDQ